MNEKIYEGYRQESCNKKGEVQGNPTEEGKDGQKRMKEWATMYNI